MSTAALLLATELLEEAMGKGHNLQGGSRDWGAAAGISLQGRP